MRALKTWTVAVCLMAIAGAAQATLADRGGGMVYDTTRGITWLADMNYAQTSGHTGTGVNADGTMTWAAATAWADNLVYGGFSDWRLPTLNPADTTCSWVLNPGGGFPNQHHGVNCTGGELSGLFVTDLGYNNNGSGLITSDDTAEQIANLALFSNVQSYSYWSGTEYAPNPQAAWHFKTNNGYQIYFGKSISFYAVAVRPGDVASPVPELPTLTMVLLGLGATAVARRRRPS